MLLWQHRYIMPVECSPWLMLGVLGILLKEKKTADGLSFPIMVNIDSQHKKLNVGGGGGGRQLTKLSKYKPGAHARHFTRTTIMAYWAADLQLIELTWTCRIYKVPTQIAKYSQVKDSQLTWFLETWGVWMGTQESELWMRGWYSGWTLLHIFLAVPSL